MGEIKLDIATGRHECDACLNANFTREGSGLPEHPCAIYALTIGEGYRQPSYLCPNCLSVLRVMLGPKNQRVAYSTLVPDFNASPPRVLVLTDTALCNWEEGSDV